MTTPIDPELVEVTPEMERVGIEILYDAQADEALPSDYCVRLFCIMASLSPQFRALDEMYKQAK